MVLSNSVLSAVAGKWMSCHAVSSFSSNRDVSKMTGKDLERMLWENSIYCLQLDHSGQMGIKV